MIPRDTIRSPQPVRGAELVLVLITVLAIGTVSLWRVDRFYGRLLSGYDAQFYYAMARSLVFDRDVDVSNDLPLTVDVSPFDKDGDGRLENVPHGESGRILSKYPIGLSLVEAPALAVAAALLPEDRPPHAKGYRPAEVWFIQIWVFSVFAAGLILLYRLLRTMVPALWAAIALAAAWWGTSLFYYSTTFLLMAHATAFTLIIGCVVLAERLNSGTGTNLTLIALGLLAAMLYLTRPQDILLLLVLAPYAARIPRYSFGAWLPGAAAAVFLLAVAIAVQGMAHAANFGRAMVSGYAALGEGFSWLHPDLWTVLLSPARGLLFISPVVVLAGLGYAVAPARVPYFGWALAAHAVLQIYLIAAWSSPEQGQAFGARMWSECAGAVAVGVAQLWHLSVRRRLLALTAIVSCVAWTLALMGVYMLKGIPESSGFSDVFYRVFELVNRF